MVADQGGPPPDWVVAPNEGWVAPRGRTPDGRVVATEGRRVLSFLVDYVIWLVPQLLVMGGIVAVFVTSVIDEEEPSGSAIAAVILLYLLVFAIGICRLAVEAEKVARRGRTWGMQAMQLRVIDARNGGPVTRGRAWGRAAFATWISSQLFGFGYWWAFFDNRNRCLHDLVCATVVIDER